MNIPRPSAHFQELWAEIYCGHAEPYPGYSLAFPTGWPWYLSYLSFVHASMVSMERLAVDNKPKPATVPRDPFLPQCGYWAVQAGLLTPLTFARHRLSPLAAFISGAYFLHNGRR